MAGTSITMNKLRKVILLHTEGKSKRFISSYLQLSRNTVKKYISRFVGLRLTVDDIASIEDRELAILILSEQEKELPPRIEAAYTFFSYAEKELKKTGVTRLQLWQEYRVLDPQGFGRSTFYEQFKRWQLKSSVSPTMHMDHKAGDMMFIDYAGKTLQIVDPVTGEVQQVQFFVAVLGGSQLTYAEASMSQKKHDFIKSVENALHYFGGVPKGIKPDNLRSAVTKSDRYEPKINDTFLDFSDHYDTTILPARSRKPKDKSLVELMVKTLYTRVYSPLRNETFHSLAELNQAVWEQLEAHNRACFTGRAYSRRALFDEIEAHTLGVLPQERFEIKKQSIVKVIMNGHACLGEDKHYYSVPYQHIGKKVKLVYSNNTVEIFYKYDRIASHPRIKSKFNYSTKKEHLASAHQFMTDWTPQRFINWAATIDKDVELYIIRVIEKKKHPEQAYKSCMGILSLHKKVGSERLIGACSRGLDYELYGYKPIKNILEKGLDRIHDHNEPDKLPSHDNIRGKDYYQ
jgi:transposase